MANRKIQLRKFCKPFCVIGIQTIVKIRINGSASSKKSRTALITPALLSKALAIVTVSNRNMPTNNCLEIAICLGSLLRDPNSTEPQAKGIATKCKKLIADGILRGPTIRENKALATPIRVSVEFVTYPFLTATGSNVVLIYPFIPSRYRTLNPSIAYVKRNVFATPPVVW